MPPTREQILNSMGTSFWAKDSLKQLENRDICDVLNDLDMLKEHFQHKFDELCGNTKYQDHNG